MRLTAIALVIAVVAACGGPRSFWLKDQAQTPSSPAASHTCWDGCMAKFNAGTLDRTSCVEACPEVEKRPVECPKDSTQCVGGPGTGLLFILLGAVGVGLLIGITIAVLI